MTGSARIKFTIVLVFLLLHLSISQKCLTLPIVPFPLNITCTEIPQNNTIITKFPPKWIIQTSHKSISDPLKKQNELNKELKINKVNTSQIQNSLSKQNSNTSKKQDQKTYSSLLIKNPCRILFQIKIDTIQTSHFTQLIASQMSKTFNCRLTNIYFGTDDTFKPLGFDYIMYAIIQQPSLKNVYQTKQQAYKLSLTNESASLISQTYVGFVRGFQTLLQLIECKKHKLTQCQIHKLPIQIIDQPSFIYRGLMIDSARHYIPLKIIYETIDALMYNKMSVLHWHIVDEDSFPLILKSHPQIAQYGAFSEQEVYTTEDVKEVIRYARVRGVRIIAQFDTPGHASSWGWAPQNWGVACTFQGFHFPSKTSFMGPLDISLDKTYKLTKEVFAEVLTLFTDPIIHLGGDQVSLACLKNLTQFLQKENIERPEIEKFYRKKQRAIIKELDPQRRCMYWMNDNLQIHLYDDRDIIHWWQPGYPTTNYTVVLSHYGQFYLDMGNGNYYGNDYGSHTTWLSFYQMNFATHLASYQNRNNVLGAEVCLWSELSNPYTHHTKIWMRSTAFAQQTWNFNMKKPKHQPMVRFSKHEKLMNRRGIPTASFTSQRCEQFAQSC